MLIAGYDPAIADLTPAYTAAGTALQANAGSTIASGQLVIAAVYPPPGMPRPCDEGCFSNSSFCFPLHSTCQV